MNNNKDVNSQLSRMRSLMTFGINEGKNVAYTGVEYEKVGADGKLYGIVREGAKYYIKTSPSKKGKLAENFDYIGGFKNRKDNEYTSFAEAQKQFDLKMMSINEANSPEKKIVVESWNPDRQEELTVESTDRMKREISRERQIMMNAMRINEKKSQNLSPISKECKDDCDGYDFKDAERPKNSFRKKGHEEGDAKKANPDYEEAKIKESAEPLAWHSVGKDANGNIADDYMDDTKGTCVGKSSPFDISKKCNTSNCQMEDGVVEEEESMTVDSDDCQNTPKVGVGKVGKSSPFDCKKGCKIEEDIEDINSDADVEDNDDLDVEDDDNFSDGEDFEGNDDDDFDDDDVNVDGDDDFDDDDNAFSDNDFEDKDDNDVDPDLHDLQNQISDLSSKLDAIMNAVGGDEPSVDSNEYENDDLYGDGDDDDDDDEENFDAEQPIEDGMAFESRKHKGVNVYESRAYRQMMMNESRRKRSRKLHEEEDVRPSYVSSKSNYFGKHPAYQKKVMELPNSTTQECPDYYDMNDESVYNEQPYGEKVGKGEPFEIDAKTLEKAVAESIIRHLGKKMVR